MVPTGNTSPAETIGAIEWRCVRRDSNPNRLIRRLSRGRPTGVERYRFVPSELGFSDWRGRDDTSQHGRLSDELIHLRYRFKVIIIFKSLSIYQVLERFQDERRYRASPLTLLSRSAVDTPVDVLRRVSNRLPCTCRHQ